MSYILGIDTGGTYTDGVIYDDEKKEVLSKGKALTTRQDLSIGIEKCLGMLDASYFPKLHQVSLSTTLATNAIVENRGNKIALFLLGDRPEGDLPAEMLLDIEGKYDIRGRQVYPLNEADVAEAVEKVRDQVGAIAVSGFASIRNNQHELQTKELIQKQADLPVVCAHEMSSRLGYYDRTVTTALNARLLSVIYELLHAVKAVLQQHDLNIPLMIVTGSGNLVSEKVALERPIETVLSGPAASIAGAMHITEQQNGLILDMGGTTTDIAQVKDGKVKMSEQGANVGGYHLHINAAEVYTYGMGGDSRIYIGAENKLVVGPKKVYPVCRAVEAYPGLYLEMKAMQPAALRQRDRRNLLDGFMLYLEENCSGLNRVQQQIVSYLKAQPHTLYGIKESVGDQFHMADLEELEDKGVVMRIAFTPTDLIHVEGGYSVWNSEAATFFAEDLAQIYGMRIEEFVPRCREVIENKLMYCLKNSDYTAEIPIIGVGAPSGAWLPGMAKRMKQELCLPEHHEVANAIGAAVASISESAKGLIRYNSVTSTYLLFLPDGRHEFGGIEEAKQFGMGHLKQFVQKRAQEAGCEDTRIFVTEDSMGSEDSFIEYEMLVTAEGKSKWLA